MGRGQRVQSWRSRKRSSLRSRRSRRHERAADRTARAARMRWMENVAYGLVGFSALAVAGVELERAGVLLGHLDHLAEEISLKLEVYAERVRAQVERDLRPSPRGGRARRSSVTGALGLAGGPRCAHRLRS